MMEKQPVAMGIELLGDIDTIVAEFRKTLTDAEKSVLDAYTVDHSELTTMHRGGKPFKVHNALKGSHIQTRLVSVVREKFAEFLENRKG